MAIQKDNGDLSPTLSDLGGKIEYSRYFVVFLSGNISSSSLVSGPNRAIFLDSLEKVNLGRIL